MADTDFGFSLSEEEQETYFGDDFDLDGYFGFDDDVNIAPPSAPAFVPAFVQPGTSPSGLPTFESGEAPGIPSTPSPEQEALDVLPYVNGAIAILRESSQITPEDREDAINYLRSGFSAPPSQTEASAFASSVLAGPTEGVSTAPPSPSFSSYAQSSAAVYQPSVASYGSSYEPQQPSFYPQSVAGSTFQYPGSTFAYPGSTFAYPGSTFAYPGSTPSYPAPSYPTSTYPTSTYPTPTYPSPATFIDPPPIPSYTERQFRFAPTTYGASGYGTSVAQRPQAAPIPVQPLSTATRGPTQTTTTTQGPTQTTTPTTTPTTTRRPAKRRRPDEEEEEEAASGEPAVRRSTRRRPSPSRVPCSNGELQAPVGLEPTLPERLIRSGDVREKTTPIHRYFFLGDDESIPATFRGRSLYTSPWWGQTLRSYANTVARRAKKENANMSRRQLEEFTRADQHDLPVPLVFVDLVRYYYEGGDPESGPEFDLPVTSLSARQKAEYITAYYRVNVQDPTGQNTDPRAYQAWKGIVQAYMNCGWFIFTRERGVGARTPRRRGEAVDGGADGVEQGD